MPAQASDADRPRGRPADDSTGNLVARRDLREVAPAREGRDVTPVERRDAVPNGPRNTIEHALELARFQIPVFPCKPNKAPATPNGFKDATTEPRLVRRLWGANEDYLIGVPTGFKFDVLDFDMSVGMWREWWENNAVSRPITRLHTTRRGGMHMLFKPHPWMRNSASSKKLGANVDTRGKGGYVIWWPGH